MKLVLLVGAALCGFALADNGPLVPCSGDYMFVADKEDCCRFHWCMSSDSSIEMRCAPGSRVPTWYTTNLDHQVPCMLDRREEVSCLRCDLQDDERLPGDPDNCVDADCGDCECQDLYDGYYCLCGGEVQPPVYVPPEDDTCLTNENRCVNGGICHQQWDDYWCECPNGYTGKNCEVFFCDQSTCLNGGTCVVDKINYHCECPPGFGGACCDEGRAEVCDECEEPDSNNVCQPRLDSCRCNPCSRNNDCVDGAQGNERTCQRICDDCSDLVDDICVTKLDLCNCNGCPNANDVCIDGQLGAERTCEPRVEECDECSVLENGRCNLLSNLCSCSSCTNFDDLCTDASAGTDRTCKARPDMSGTPFSFVYMQNRPDDTEQRELEIYVTSAGINNQRVRIYSPYLAPDDGCYFEMIEMVNSFQVRRFVVPDHDCYEPEGSKVFNRMVKVESVGGGDLLVYAVNRDQWSADAWIAYPDGRAANDFFVMAYGPATFGTQFAVLALENDTTLQFTYTGEAIPAINYSDGRLTLQAGEAVQIQSREENGDLSGTRIQSDKPVHAYSGNIRARIIEVMEGDDIQSNSRDHIIEQLIPVHAWGTEYNIQPVPNREFGDQIKIIAAENGTQITVVGSGASGSRTQSFSLNSGRFAVFDAYSDNVYKVTSNKKISVGQFTKSKDQGESSNDPSLIIVPAVEQYTNNYVFSTPDFSGGASGISKPYNTSFVFLTAKTEDREGIVIENGNNDFFASSQTTYGDWMQLPDSDYWSKAVEIGPGTNIIRHGNSGVTFSCIFYGMDDRESLGFPIGMMLYTLPCPNDQCE